MSNTPLIFWLVPVASLIALGFAWHFFRSMMKESEGTPRMKEIAAHVRKGAMAYLRQQYRVVAIVFLILVLFFAFLAYGLGVQNPWVPFAFLTGDDPTYAEIDGAWLSDRPYATIHRVASDGTHRGVFAEVMAFAVAMQPHLRIDTHAQNLPMQRQIERFGFRYCGVIQCRNGARMAFERVPEKK